MAFEIVTEADEFKYVKYLGLRNKVRDIMAHGVYPNLVVALAAYAALDAAFATGGELDDVGLKAYHAELIQLIQPYVDQLRQDAASIVTAMEAINAAAPDAFGLTPIGGLNEAYQ